MTPGEGLRDDSDRKVYMSQQTKDVIVFDNVENVAPASPAAAGTPVSTQAAELQADLDALKTYKLAKPLVANGRELTELNLDIDLLNGRQFKEAEKEYRMRFRGDTLSVPLSDVRFREIIVGKLNGIIGEDLENLPAGEYNAIMFRIQGFFGARV